MLPCCLSDSWNHLGTVSVWLPRPVPHISEMKIKKNPLPTTTAYYNINIRDTVRKCLPVWFQCLCVSAKPPPHNTPTHMSRDGWRQNESYITLCRPNNAETHCCPWVKNHRGSCQGKILIPRCSLLLLIDLCCVEWCEREWERMV